MMDWKRWGILLVDLWYIAIIVAHIGWAAVAPPGVFAWKFAPLMVVFFGFLLALGMGLVWLSVSIFKGKLED